MYYRFLNILYLGILTCTHIQAATLLSVDSIHADLDSLKLTVLEVHPTHAQQNFERKIDSLKNTIQSPISNHDVFRKLQPTLAIDGHTTLQLNSKITPDMANPFLPFEVIIHQDRVYIKKNHSEHRHLVRGTEIIRINSQPIAELLPQMRSMMQGELDAYKNTKFTNEGFAFWYRMRFGNFAEFNLDVSLGHEIKSIFVAGVKRNVFTRNTEPMLAIEKISKHTALLKIRRFRKPKQFLPKIDSIFTALSADKIEHLILDIKGGGGFSDLADSLMSYLTDQPYRQYERREVKISAETEAYLIDYQGERIIHDGFFITTPLLRKPADKHNRFTGRIWIITGPEAYSTMTLFIAMAKAYTEAVIIGEETGQPLISNGNISRHQLPNTGMKYYLSHAIFHMPGAVSDNKSVIPHHMIQPNLEDLLDDRDVRLEHTLNLIRKHDLK